MGQLSELSPARDTLKYAVLSKPDSDQQHTWVLAGGQTDREASGRLFWHPGANFEPSLKVDNFF